MEFKITEAFVRTIGWIWTDRTSSWALSRIGKGIASGFDSGNSLQPRPFLFCTLPYQGLRQSGLRHSYELCKLSEADRSRLSLP